MYISNEDTKTTTLISYIGPLTEDHPSYAAAKIFIAEDFDIASLPKSVRAHRLMTIDCTPRAENAKNETGIKRLRRILKALDQHKVKVITTYGNSLTEDEFFARYA